MNESLSAFDFSDYDDDYTGHHVEEDTSKFLSFALGGEEYALEILSIKEIIEYASVTRVPMVPRYIRGVINLRGSVVPVIDLSARMGKASQDVSRRTCIVIVEMELPGEEDVIDIGVMVDAVNEVLDISDVDVEPAPSFGVSIRTDFIRGMGRVEEKFVILLDEKKVLSMDELSALKEIATTDRRQKRSSQREPENKSVESGEMEN